MKKCTYPILLYGAQTWATTKNQTKRLQKTQLVRERSILGISRKERIKNITIRKKTLAKDVGYLSKKLKWKFAGRMIRREENRWEKHIFKWIPYNGKRRKGRPKRRWKDELREYAGILWGRDARVREHWKKVGEVYAQRWALET